MARAKIIDPGFSVADAGWPELRDGVDGLEAEFTDWREMEIRIRFVDAVSYSWQSIDDIRYEGERFDCCHVIDGSEWIAVHKAQGALDEGEIYHHFKLNFNACGTLEVIARQLEMLSEERKKQDDASSQ